MLAKWWPLLALLPAQAMASEKVSKATAEIQPLSEEFLLFLAEMEEVDGQLIHPVDMEVAKLAQKKLIIETTEKTAKAKSKKDEDN